MEELKEIYARLRLAFVTEDSLRADWALDDLRVLIDEKPSGKHFAKEEVPW